MRGRRWVKRPIRTCHLWDSVSSWFTANDLTSIPRSSQCCTSLAVVVASRTTAALVERDGRVVRIGAEGFYARRTRLLVSAVGGQELMSDEDIVAARTLRREDLPGAPVAWKVAMRELVGRVIGRHVR